MSRRPDDQTFRKTDFNRLDAAARELGKSIVGFEATLAPDGTRTIKATFEPTKNGGAGANPLDQWMENHAGQTEGH